MERDLIAQDNHDTLRPSIGRAGDYVTQIIHFVGGHKRTFHGIKTASIKQGEFTKMNLKDGRILMINTQNVLLVEVFPEKKPERNGQQHHQDRPSNHNKK